MSVSLQSLMVEVPVTRPKRTRLRRAGTAVLIVVGVIAFLAVLLVLAGIKFVVMHTVGLIGR